MKDTVKEAKIFRFPNAVVRVYSPELTPQERAARMEAIRKQTAAFMKAAN